MNDSEKRQVLAVDVSSYSLWTEDENGRALIKYLIGDLVECEKIFRFVREADQVRSFAGKLLARLAVCISFDKVKWHQIRFAIAKSGRPYLSFPPVKFDFNISHDGDWVAIVFAKGNELENQSSLGIDVMEVHLPHFEESVSSFVDTMDMTLTKKERHWIMSSIDDHERLTRLYTLWTYKEAFTKSRGIGLSFDFSKIEFAMWHRDEEMQLINMDLENVESANECFEEFVLPPGNEMKRRDHFGTGQESLLVVARPKCEIDNRQIPLKPMTAIEAEQLNQLKILTMDELIQSSRQQSIL